MIQITWNTAASQTKVTWPIDCRRNIWHSEDCRSGCKTREDRTSEDCRSGYKARKDRISEDCRSGRKTRDDMTTVDCSSGHKTREDRYGWYSGGCSSDKDGQLRRNGRHQKRHWWCSWRWCKTVIDRGLVWVDIADLMNIGEGLPCIAMIQVSTHTIKVFT